MIKLDKVQFAYNKKKPLFDNLSLEIKKNKIYGLLGRNGMGKSTLMKLIAGFLPTHAGTLLVDKHTPSNRGVGLMENIFFLNEDFELPNVRIPDYIAAYAGFYPRFDENTFYSILKEFEVGAEEQIASLSFGQKKKVIIAFGLATNVSYIFFDEPTNGLDIPSKSQFRKLLAKHFTEDQSIIISTHQIRDLSNLLDAVIIIDKGVITLSKDITEIENKVLFSNYSIANKTSIYSEVLPGGTVHLYPNEEGEDSQIEIESFFNAMLQEADSLTKLINS